MTVARRRQMARLENLAAPRIEQIRVAKAQLEQKAAARIYNDALTHAANLSLIILFGDPRIEEPLSSAWGRCCKSASPELCDDVSQENMLKDYISPFDGLGACCNADFFRQRVLPRLPGTDLKEKFASIFAAAPPWLLWFTWADLTTGELDLPLWDFSAVHKFRRSKDDFFRWPVLPSGKFENIQMSDFEVAEKIRKANEAPEPHMGLLELKYRWAMDEIAISAC
jgi:hypothetical protein